MGTFVVADAIFEQRRSEFLGEYYRREWYQFQAVDRLEKKLRLSKVRLGLSSKPAGFRLEQAPTLERSAQL
ncbi:MAG: hypothetical protein ABI577_09830 [bacterium]